MEPAATITFVPGPQQPVHPQSSGSESELLTSKPGVYAKLALHVTCQSLVFSDFTWLFSQFPINWVLASKSKLLADFSIVLADLAVVLANVSILQSHFSFLFSYISFLQPFVAILLTHLSILLS